MTTTVTPATADTTTDTTTDVVTGGAPTRKTDPALRFARWGVLGGLTGLTAVVASGFTGAIYDKDAAQDPDAIVGLLADMTTPILVFHTAAVASAFLLVVFAAGLHHHLARRVPDGSLLPGTAAGGLMLVSVALLMGSGLTTEFVFGVTQPELLVPESAVFFDHWINTIPWVWGGAGLTAVALGLASVRHAATARWIGWSSLALGGLTLLFGVSPLQYMAGMTGPLWLLVASVGLLVSRPGRS